LAFQPSFSPPTNQPTNLTNIPQLVSSHTYISSPTKTNTSCPSKLKTPHVHPPPQQPNTCNPHHYLKWNSTQNLSSSTAAATAVKQRNTGTTTIAAGVTCRIVSSHYNSPHSISHWPLNSRPLSDKQLAPPSPPILLSARIQVNSPTKPILSFISHIDTHSDVLGLFRQFALLFVVFAGMELYNSFLY